MVGGNADHIHRRDLYSAVGRVEDMVFTARRSYASAVLEVVIGSRPSDYYFRSVCWFVCLFVCAEFFSAVFDPILIKL